MADSQVTVENGEAELPSGATAEGGGRTNRKPLDWRKVIEWV